jgi:hypothetical protein
MGRIARSIVATTITTSMLLTSHVPVASALAGNTVCRDVAVYNLQEGALRIGGGILGASASIEFVSPPLCSSGGGVDEDTVRGSFTWVGVQNADHGPFSIYQLGLGKCIHNNISSCSGSLHWIWAWGRDQAATGCGSFQDVVPDPKNISAPTSGTHSYEVVRGGSNVQFKIDGVVKESIPSSAICWTASAAAYAAETWDHGDQLGENFPSSQLLSNAKYESATGVWSGTGFGSCFTSTGTPEYLCSLASGQSVNVWTDRR